VNCFKQLIFSILCLLNKFVGSEITNLLSIEEYRLLFGQGLWGPLCRALVLGPLNPPLISNQKQYASLGFQTKNRCAKNDVAYNLNQVR